jgi:hypothetical protein
MRRLQVVGIMQIEQARLLKGTVAPKQDWGADCRVDRRSVKRLETPVE